MTKGESRLYVLLVKPLVVDGQSLGKGGLILVAHNAIGPIGAGSAHGERQLESMCSSVLTLAEGLTPPHKISTKAFPLSWPGVGYLALDLPG